MKYCRIRKVPKAELTAGRISEVREAELTDEHKDRDDGCLQRNHHGRRDQPKEEVLEGKVETGEGVPGQGRRDQLPDNDAEGDDEAVGDIRAERDRGKHRLIVAQDGVQGNPLRRVTKRINGRPQRRDQGVRDWGQDEDADTEEDNNQQTRSKDALGVPPEGGDGRTRAGPTGNDRRGHVKLLLVENQGKRI